MSAITAGLILAATGENLTSLGVAFMALMGVGAGIMATVRGRKVERASEVRETKRLADAQEAAAASDVMGHNIEANNKLIDQLQETTKDQAEENARLRAVVSSLDTRVAQLEADLAACSIERVQLQIRIKEYEDAT
jgi:uncharacterized protein HemX